MCSPWDPRSADEHVQQQQKQDGVRMWVNLTWTMPPYFLPGSGNFSHLSQKL